MKSSLLYWKWLFVVRAGELLAAERFVFRVGYGRRVLVVVAVIVLLEE